MILIPHDMAAQLARLQAEQGKKICSGCGNEGGPDAVCCAGCDSPFEDTTPAAELVAMLRSGQEHLRMQDSPQEVADMTADLIRDRGNEFADTIEGLMGKNAVLRRERDNAEITAYPTEAKEIQRLEAKYAEMRSAYGAVNGLLTQRDAELAQLRRDVAELLPSHDAAMEWGIANGYDCRRGMGTGGLSAYGLLMEVFAELARLRSRDEAAAEEVAAVVELIDAAIPVSYDIGLQLQRGEMGDWRGIWLPLKRAIEKHRHYYDEDRRTKQEAMNALIKAYGPAGIAAFDAGGGEVAPKNVVCTDDCACLTAYVICRNCKAGVKSCRWDSHAAKCPGYKPWSEVTDAGGGEATP